VVEDDLLVEFGEFGGHDGGRNDQGLMPNV
jgi:hypothetical protein